MLRACCKNPRCELFVHVKGENVSTTSKEMNVDMKQNENESNQR
jgi:hypothetical protein